MKFTVTIFTNQTKRRVNNMEERILNAVSLTELIALRKEVLSTRYTDQDSEYFIQLIDEQIENFK